MANKNLFRSAAYAEPKVKNEAGGKAYKFSDEHTLAQYAVTGCLTDTYYASSKDQLDKVIGLTEGISDEFIAKTAIYARESGFMKDMPAVLLGVLASRKSPLLGKVFPRVVDNAKMLRNFVQVVRSGVTGRKSLGSGPRNMIRAWLESKPDNYIFNGSIGNDPSLADVIKLAHPAPTTASRDALYNYILGNKDQEKFAKLPQLVKDYELFKAGLTTEIPKVSFEMLTALPLSEDNWKNIAANASWTQTRMNLNTFARHGVFNSKIETRRIADKLSNADEVRKAKVFPYQLLAAYLNADTTVPKHVKNALQDAMEIAVENVPTIDGQVYVFPDVSGSMGSSVTGYRGSATSKVTCIDVAALVAASFMRKNPDTVVMPFENRVVNVTLNGRDSVMTNAEKLRKIGGGGTNCSAPMHELNSKAAKGDLVIYVSDNQSWMDSAYNRGQTGTKKEWDKFHSRNPGSKLVCIDIQPYDTTQAGNKANEILNVGGFSDNVFTVISEFASGGTKKDHWVNVIKKISLG